MIKLDFEAEINGLPALVVVKHVDRPSVSGKLLELGEFSIAVPETVDANGELWLTLRLKPRAVQT